MQRRYILLQFPLELGTKKGEIMDTRNCRKCGRLFNYVTGPIICRNCVSEIEEQFQRVKKYIREHNNTEMNVVAEECEVEVIQIQKWIRDERLIFGNSSSSGMVCEKCNVPLATGRYCTKCKNETANEMSEAIRGTKTPLASKKVENSGSKMRFKNFQEL